MFKSPKRRNSKYTIIEHINKALTLALSENEGLSRTVKERDGFVDPKKIIRIINGPDLMASVLNLETMGFAQNADVFEVVRSVVEEWRERGKAGKAKDVEIENLKAAQSIMCAETGQLRDIIRVLEKEEEKKVFKAVGGIDWSKDKVIKTMTENAILTNKLHQAELKMRRLRAGVRKHFFCGDHKSCGTTALRLFDANEKKLAARRSKK